jgi:hypothetical protein
MNLKLPNNFFEFISKLQLRQRLFLAGGIIFLFGYALYDLIISAQALNLKSVRRQLAAPESLIEAKKSKAKRLLMLEDRYNQLQGQADKNNQRFFSDEEAIDFLKQLDSLVEKQTGNRLVLIQPLAKQVISESLLGKPKRFYQRQDVQLVVSGQFNGILELLRQLYDSEKLLGLKGISIEVEEEIPLRLKANFLLSMYFLEQQPEGAAGNEIK